MVDSIIQKESIIQNVLAFYLPSNYSNQNDFFSYNRIFEDLIGKITSNILNEKLSNENKKWIKKFSNNEDAYKKSIKMHENIANTFFNF